ncbi:MAG: hypothetical protein R3F26_05695 [Gammaproteobacteria bacterium]
MRDSYQIFFANGLISKEEFFEFGLSETIYVDFDTAATAWEDLKFRLQSNERVVIRGFGRDAAGTHLFKKLYEYMFGNRHIQKDATNNAEPTRLLRQWTGLSKSGGIGFDLIRNYQISHVFGRTKNPLCFTAPWNIVYIPKIIDPFTGHEATGDMVDEYTRLFQAQCYRKFKSLIDDYNVLVTNPDFLANLNTSLQLMALGESIQASEMDKLHKSLKSEFSPIAIQT